MGLVRPLRVLAVAAATLLSVTACLSILEGQAVSKDAEPLPKTERAVLLGRSRWYLVYGLDISIWTVDGVLYHGAGLRRIELAPGRHTVVIEAFAFVGGMGGTSHVAFTPDLQAGHVYKIRLVRDSPQCTVEIKDFPPSRDEAIDLRLPCEIYRRSS